jgi:hypothetical protein
VEGGASFQNQMAFGQQTAYQQQHQQSAQMRGYGTVSQQGFHHDQAPSQAYFHSMHETNATSMSGMARQENMGQQHGRIVRPNEEQTNLSTKFEGQYGNCTFFR